MLKGNSNCCSPTCDSAIFSCDSGYIKDSSKSTYNLPASNSNCCSINCASFLFSCNSNYVKDITKSTYNSLPASNLYIIFFFLIKI